MPQLCALQAHGCGKKILPFLAFSLDKPTASRYYVR